MSCFVSIPNRERENWHYKVPDEVFDYIKQLEYKIRYPWKSKLKLETDYCIKDEELFKV